jgi:hypothetical protein
MSRISLGTAPPRPSMFIGNVELMNVALYISRCYITNEYILNLPVPLNTLGYVRHWQYIHRHICRLTDKFYLFLCFM